MGEKTGADRYAFRLYVQSGVRWIWGGGLLMIAGALLSGWREEARWLKDFSRYCCYLPVLRALRL
ncbi:cytochrome c-type biogenesis CcmF C-terminal domain-containing protein [Escherichia coli]